MSLLDLNQEQKDAVEEFKKHNLKNCSPKMLEDESIFYRFMKARDFNFEEADAMFQKHLAWRKEYRIDTITTDYTPPEVLTKYYPNSLIGYDKEGCIVRYLDVGGGDSKGILQSCKKEDFIKCNLYIAEKDMDELKERSERLGKSLTKIVYINNYEKMTLAKATCKPALEMMMLGATMYQDNYPERTKSIYIINASIYFTIIYSVLKHLLAPALAEKIKVFGNDGWKEALLEEMDADQLPAFLGGDRTDPDGDPMCKNSVIHGELVPERYYLRKTQTLANAPGVKKVKLAPFSKYDVKFEVESPGSIMEWEFETKSKDIGFGVYYKEHSSSAKVSEVFPKQRIETCFEPEVGMYKCEGAGTYTIVFDNSYSWIHSKEVYFKAKIVEPNAIPAQ